VDDWVSGSAIVGIHMYRNVVRWPRCADPLFTDLPPAIRARRRYLLNRPPSPLAAHSPDPSPLQAFHYGLHRGLKAFPRGEAALRPLHAIVGWRLLKRIWRRFEGCGDPRLGLAQLAVNHVLERGVTPEECSYSGPGLRDLLSLYEGMSVEEMRDRLAPTWGSTALRELRWARNIARQSMRRRRLAPRRT
jgi:hypothetical protein